MLVASGSMAPRLMRVSSTASDSDGVTRRSPTLFRGPMRREGKGSYPVVTCSPSDSGDDWTPGNHRTRAPPLSVEESLFCGDPREWRRCYRFTDRPRPSAEVMLDDLPPTLAPHVVVLGALDGVFRLGAYRGSGQRGENLCSSCGQCCACAITTLRRRTPLW